MKFLSAPTEKIIVCGLLLIALFTHGFNMFDFPYYENDEAVYVSQAWAVTEQGKLAPYTYWYDHAPAGWFLIAGWAKLTLGYFTFGESVNSGRVLMLLLHLASTFFLYFITKKVSSNRNAGIIAALIFSLSPLAIHFQRRVLLDNIMIFWALFAGALLLIDRLKLRHILLSAVFVAIACLSKETAVFLIPAFIFLLFRVTHTSHKIFGVILWLAVVGVIVSFYPLYALIQSEFFEYGTKFGGAVPHVSLIETLKFQGSRPGGSVFDPANSVFWHNLKRWYSHDAFLIAGGIISTIILTLGWIRKRKSLIGFVLLLNIFSLLFLMRGGVVIEFYVIPLIPLFASTIGILITKIVGLLENRRIPYFFLATPAIFIIITSGYVFFHHSYQGLNVYTANQTKPQIEALTWIRENAQPGDYIVTDNYLWLDLNAPENPSGKVFPNAEWYWKVERDKEVKDGLLNGDTHKVDYVVQTPQVVIDTRTSDFKFIAQVLDESKPIATFDNDNWSVIIWGHRSPEKILKRSWTDYKQNFIDENGRVIDPERSNTYTSEAQSYALLKSVWMDDRETFDQVLKWTVENLEQESGIFTWKAPENTQSGGSVDTGTATDADQDIALALIFASRKWPEGNYKEKAHRVLNGIWQEEIAYQDGTPYASAGNWAHENNVITLNPSYLSPAWYKVFASFDTSHPWNDLVNSSYQALRACSFANLGKAPGVLPPDWCALDQKTGAFSESRTPRPVSTDYSYDAFRTSWRIALDYHWFKDSRAYSYLEQLEFLGKEYATRGILYASYEHDGKARDKYESTGIYAGNLGYFKIVEPELLEKYYNEKILAYFYENKDRSYWQAENNYYTQNWAWFGTALYGDLLPNLWIE